MSKFLISSLIVGASIIPPIAFADGQTKHFSIGPDAGIYFPSDGKIRSIFGSSIFSAGLHFGGADTGVSNGRFGVNVGLVDAQKNGGDFYAFQLLAQYEQFFTRSSQGSVLPYFEVGAGLAYADYQFNYNSTHYSSKTALPTARIGVGLLIDKNFRISADYDFFGSTNGFSFDGLELKATYTVLRF